MTFFSKAAAMLFGDQHSNIILAENEISIVSFREVFNKSYISQNCIKPLRMNTGMCFLTNNLCQKQKHELQHKIISLTLTILNISS